MGRERRRDRQTANEGEARQSPLPCFSLCRKQALPGLVLSCSSSRNHPPRNLTADRHTMFHPLQLIFPFRFLTSARSKKITTKWIKVTSMRCHSLKHWVPHTIQTPRYFDKNLYLPMLQNLNLQTTPSFTESNIQHESKRRRG